MRAGTSSSIEVAASDQRQRPADEALRGDVQHAGTVARTAHARIGDADHVAHALLQQLLRDREHAPLRHAGAPERAGIAQHQDRGGVDLERLVVDAAGHVVVVVEHHGFAGVPKQLWDQRRWA